MYALPQTVPDIPAVVGGAPATRRQPLPTCLTRAVRQREAGQDIQWRFGESTCVFQWMTCDVEVWSCSLHMCID